MEFRKAHGTGNDFVVLPDVDGRMQLSEELVRRLCDRRFGVGADGVLRVVRTESAGEAIPDSSGCEFFMDYRNADGSAAQMCGNGARVFAQYLWDAGLAPAGPVRFATRGGARTAERVDGGSVRVDMGMAQMDEIGGVDVAVGPHRWPATRIHVPNPHAVVFVTDLDEAGPLLSAPRVTPAAAFPEGANVEFVVRRGVRHIALRVHERGVGETLSCGTGACAAAVAAAADAEPGGLESEMRVDVPGGILQVSIGGDGFVALTGPTATVAEGRLVREWLQGAQ